MILSAEEALKQINKMVTEQCTEIAGLTMAVKGKEPAVLALVD